MNKQFIFHKGIYGQRPAHELGHGAFGLKHTFDPEYGVSDNPQITPALNLMGYNDQAHLAKFQWDIIHQHSGETAFDSTDAVMARFIIIDSKHTQLFNHVYDNNLNPYKAGAGSYQTEDWPVAWTYSDDKPEELVDKVINKLRNAASGQTVPKITLRDNGIYVGKHTVGNNEYATAIYSRKAVIGGIKKVAVSDVKDLEKYSVIKQPLYCETSYMNYLILAFYEDDEDDPSLIIQATQGKTNVFSNEQLEAWMKYIGVMRENILRCVINSKDKLEHPDLPYCGDPLAEMRIVGTDENDQNSHIGGLYGCVRYTAFLDEQKCAEWAANITNFPSISDKNKVHDGIDLYAALNTALYSMYNGTVEAVYNSSTSDLGNYLVIKSTKSDHLLSNEDATVFVAYGHLQSISVKKGDVIKQGQLIGYTGNSGNASNIDPWRYHVHLQVYRINTGNKYNRVNPIDYITTKFDKNNGNKIN
jgi:hypothetical protein